LTRTQEVEETLAPPQAVVFFAYLDPVAQLAGRRHVALLRLVAQGADDRVDVRRRDHEDTVRLSSRLSLGLGLGCALASLLPGAPTGLRWSKPAERCGLLLCHAFLLLSESGSRGKIDAASAFEQLHGYARTKNVTARPSPCHNHVVVGDWVPVATAGIAAVAGFGGAWLTGRLTLARERTARQQQRKAEAYLELLARMSLLSDVANRVFKAKAESEGRLPTPDPAEVARISALITAYASDLIRDDLYPTWRKAIDEMANSEEPVERFRAFIRSRNARAKTVARIRNELEIESERRPGWVPGMSRRDAPRRSRK